MKKIYINHVKFCLIIGFGYWKDVYKKDIVGIEGVAHNFVLPFLRMQYGYLEKD
jgi:hypothetical protein